MVDELKAGQIVAELLLKDSQYQKALKDALFGAKKFEKSQTSITSNIASSWKKMFLSLGTAATLGFAFRSIVKAGATLEKTFANISTLGDISADTMSDMESQVKQLSEEIRKSPVDLAEGLYQAISAGAAAGSESIDILTVSAKFATAGLTTTATAVDAITNATNAYGIENLSAARAGDIMFKIVEKGKTTAERIAPQLGKVTATAKSLGISFEEVGAASALMTRTMPTEQAITSLSGAMRGLTGAADKFAIAGIDIYQVLKEEGLGGALKRLQSLTGGNLVELKKFIKEEEALKGILALTGENLGKYNDLLKEMEESTGAVNTAVQKQMDTTASLTDGLQTAFKGLANSIFEQLQPAYDRFLKVSTFVIKNADDLIKKTEKQIELTADQQRFLDDLTDAYESGMITEEEAIRSKETFYQAIKLNRDLLKETVIDTEDSNQQMARSEEEFDQLRAAARRASLIEITDAEEEHYKNLLAKQQKYEDDYYQSEVAHLQRLEAGRINLLDEMLTADIAAGEKRMQKIKQDEAILRGIEVDAINGKIARQSKEEEIRLKESEQRVAQIDADRAAIEETNQLAQARAKGIQEFSSQVWGAIGQGWADTTANFIANSDEMENSQAAWAEAADNLWDQMKEKAISNLISIVGQSLIQAAISAAGWAPAAALSATATGGATAGAAATAIGSLMAFVGKFVPKREIGGPISQGIFMGHDDEYVLSRMQTQQLSSILGKLNRNLAGDSAGSNVEVIIKPTINVSRFFDFMNYEVTVNKRKLTANASA